MISLKQYVLEKLSFKKTINHLKILTSILTNQDENIQKNIGGKKRMIVVGQISTPEEAREIEYITRISIVGRRVRSLALTTRE